MQTLIFEPAWNKTIAPQDRNIIERLFQKTKKNDTNNITLLQVSQAFNHKKDLLVIVLLHNFTSHEFSFEDIDLVYLENDKIIAKSHFSFPQLMLAAQS